jgi:hypothetical protein
MEQSSGEFTGKSLDDDELPLRKLDFAGVFASRSVLREQARPVLRGALDHGASSLMDAEDA